jgi:putative lipoic acid-binding regulatory protein
MPEGQENRHSALELIEYPSRFPLKVFGSQTAQFEQAVLELVRARSPQTEHFEVSRRASRGGKYTALTVTFTAYSQKQLEDIYQDLHECEHVVMSL